MQFNDQFQYVKRNMGKNRLRLFMTVLATTMGCAFLIVLASVGFGLQDSIVDEMMQHQIMNEISIYGREEGEDWKEVEESDIEEIRQLEHIQAIVTRSHVRYPVEISVGSYSGSVTTQLTNLEEEEKSGYSLLDGRFPEQENEIIVGYHTNEILYDSDENEEPTSYQGSLLNETVTLTVYDWEEDIRYEEEFVIVGIGAEPEQEWRHDSSVFISESMSGREILLSEEIDGEVYSYELDVISVYATDAQQVEGLSNSLKDKGFMIDSVSERIDGMSLFFTALKTGLIIVGTVAVVIASIGIFNTMTMAVTERTQEIGIMKAIGADPTVIRRLFLMESAIIGLLGVVIGVILSYAISFAVNWIIPRVLVEVTETPEFMDVTFSAIPIQLVAIAAFISMTVAIVSGIRPAKKATKIHVLSALRREA
ncbi:ABC transporter permease [Alkalihalobacillus hemicellulosilyticus]|uniref:ABC transporter n=1 Tax=Halalkalibacter hemicellulosilyticusJCM 9152 TaxID=1236971 RepID=W4QDY7_9BACI|nr:FtsX-like permease family protein [Halalkalibacter hemicellulosilyticus]GAE30270.1 ABC transporter [Halalkalibacter hemicellulosilyticusJCM 9152]